MHPRPDEDFFAHRRGGPPAVVYRDRRLALRVDGDAPDRRRADAFTELVAFLPEPRAPRALSRSWMCVGRSGRVMFCSALVLWVVVLLGIATGLPVLPLMIAGLVVTAVVAALRYAHHRAARG